MTGCNTSCITSEMVQPKQPPVSIRISDDLKARVAKFAEERKITRNAAYAVLLEAGLAGLTAKSFTAALTNARTKVAELSTERKSPAPKLSIQLGPVIHKPGALMKTPKGSKK